MDAHESTRLELEYHVELLNELRAIYDRAASLTDTISGIPVAVLEAMLMPVADRGAPLMEVSRRARVAMITLAGLEVPMERLRAAIAGRLELLEREVAELPDYRAGHSVRAGLLEDGGE
jgi:hypothetical protein